VPAMLHDIAERRFITAGMTAWALMVPLALTSTAWSIRRLGGKRWQRLHRLIYFSAAAGVIHFIWLVKADLRRPLTYGAVLVLLLAFRIGQRALNSAKSPSALKRRGAEEAETG
jgi:methionine sulfoxide reductase heme-binding subunit